MDKYNSSNVVIKKLNEGDIRSKLKNLAENISVMDVQIHAFYLQPIQ